MVNARLEKKGRIDLELMLKEKSSTYQSLLINKLTSWNAFSHKIESLMGYSISLVDLIKFVYIKVNYYMSKIIGKF